MPKYVLNKSWHYIKGENTSLLKKDNIVTIVIFQVIHFPKKSFKKHLCEFVQKSEDHIDFENIRAMCN